MSCVKIVARCTIGVRTVVICICIIIFYLLGDKCQYWLQDENTHLASPFYSKEYIMQLYYNNLNCTWLLKADEGYYINFEMKHLQVNADHNALIF